MLTDYAPILILLGLILGFVVVNLLVSDLLGKKRRNPLKGGAYECGMVPQGSARLRLSIHFYLVAVTFIVFDVEAIFLLLWATAAKDFVNQNNGLAWIAFGQVAFFIGVLGLALLYEWRKGGLKWDR